MNEKQWEGKAKGLAKAHAVRLDEATPEIEALGLARPTASELRRALVEVDQLWQAAPAPIKQRYKAIDESVLRSAADAAESELDNGSLAWLGSDVVLAAAAQVRALDRHLFHHADTRGKPRDAANDFLCEATRTHVIPRPLAKPPALAAIGTKTYRRRGLIWHRLIPGEIDGYTIELHWYRDLSLSFRRKDTKVLGAVFDRLSLVRDEAFKKFVASDAPCADEDAALAAQVAAAYTGDIVAALWPELCMPPSRREKLAACLEACALDLPPGQGPTLVAAGSWHEVEGKRVRNRLHILSGSGRARFYHDKSLPVESKTLGEEELDPSYRIAVLIGEDALIAFGICRDFCEAQITKVYLSLDVDLVIVPSYGDEKTILAHRQQAHALAIDPGTRAFVVQQVATEAVDACGAGYILAPEANTAAITPAEMATKPCFAVHPISFKKV